MNTRHFNPSQIGRYSIYLTRRDGRLSWRRWPVIYWGGFPAHRQSPIQVLTQPGTGYFVDRTQCVTATPHHQPEKYKYKYSVIRHIGWGQVLLRPKSRPNLTWLWSKPKVKSKVKTKIKIKSAGNFQCQNNTIRAWFDQTDIPVRYFSVIFTFCLVK